MLRGERAGFDVHLAVFVEPYLGFALDGHKTVESRFSLNRSAPYLRVNSGDVILLKRSGGRIAGLCRASHAWYYALEPGGLVEIRERFGRAICAQGEEFWTSRERTAFASLIQIDCVTRLAPVPFPKRDRRGWVVLRCCVEEGREAS